MSSQYKGLLPGVVLIAVALSVTLFMFGPFTLTGFATTGAVTTTTISSPATGAEFKPGETFTVSVVVGCQNSRCNTVKSTISFPAGGLILKSTSSLKSWTAINSGTTQTTSWLVQANSTGNRQVQVSTTSKNAASSSSLISITVFVPACNSNNDCGTSQYVTGPYCGSGGSVYRDYQSFTCNYPGTKSASCQSTVTPILMSECGNSGPIGSTFCSGSSVYQKYLSVGCTNGYCTNGTSDMLVQDCPYGCTGGVCNAANPDTCSDTDGLNLNTLGQVSGNVGGSPYSYSDSCFSTDQVTEFTCSGSVSTSGVYSCGSSGNIGSPYCIGSSVYQNYASRGCSLGVCTNSSSSNLVQTCANGCTNGACNSAPSDSCSDTDGGYVTSVQGTVSGVLNGSTYSNTDSCIGSAVVSENYCVGTSKKTNLSSCGSDYYSGANYCLNGNVVRNYVDYYCASGACGVTTTPTVVQTCTSGCTGGVCNSVTTDSCADNDGGYYPQIPGSVTGYKNNFPYNYSDFCISASVQLEYYCSGTLAYNFSSGCPVGNGSTGQCFGGSCY